MKKVIPILVVLVVIVGAVVLIMNKNNSSKTTTGSSGNMSMSHSSNGSSTNKQATNKVTIQNYAFSPANISVKKGTTVTWTNQDSVAHTVQETDGKTGPMSQDIDQGKSFSFTYNTVGTFNYHCSIHPDMVGTVTVTE